MRDLAQASAGAIRSSAVPGDWLVAGWFTPDYRPLAEKFAANLAKHNAPYHLWAKPKSERGWNTWRKPSVVLETMDAYPGKTVILMDVDCTVKGDISPIANAAGDVGATIMARYSILLWPPRKRLTIKTSSRVVVFRPTAGARAFAIEWAHQCKRTHYAGDESAMAIALLTPCLGIAYSHLDRRYAGIGGTDAVICHESAHERQQTWAVGVLKGIERRFRTGRTRAAKLAGPGGAPVAAAAHRAPGR